MNRPQPSGRRPISKKLSPEKLWVINMSVMLFIELINPLAAINSPLAAGDAQLSGRDDVGDVVGDEHAAGDEQTVEGCVNLFLV
jgi:hypothetical protein